MLRLANTTIALSLKTFKSTHLDFSCLERFDEGAFKPRLGLILIIA